MADVPYFPLEFDGQGNLVDPDQQEQILQSLGTPDLSITDLWIFAYGWNNDVHSASSQQTYEQWRTLLQEQLPHLADQGHVMRPLIIEVFWPSLAWAGQVAQLISARQADGSSSQPNNEERQSFIEHYRTMLTSTARPENAAADDLGRIYDLLSSPQLSGNDVKEFVQRLLPYQLDDPHNDEHEAVNIMHASVDQITKRLLTAPLVPTLQMGAERVWTWFEHTPDTLFSQNVLDFFRVFTFWTMKARSAVVGEKGVYPFLKAVKAVIQHQQLPIRIHLLGHSFGAKLVTAAIYPSKDDASAPFVDTLVLLLGAFSKFAFSITTPAVQQMLPRGYAPVVQQRLVAHPLLVIYSSFDLANLLFYPLGMIPIFESVVFGQQPVLDFLSSLLQPFLSARLGALGANGAQGLDAHAVLSFPQLRSLDQDYTWGEMKAISCINIDSGNVIRQGSFPAAAHNDIFHPEIFHAALTLAAH